MVLNANVWNVAVTVAGLLACFSVAQAAPEERSDAEAVLEHFKNVPAKLERYVAQAEAIVAKTAADAPVFEGPVSRQQISTALSSVSQSIDKLTLGIVPFSDLPEGLKPRAKKQPTRWIFYSEEEQIHYIVAERAVSLITSEKAAVRAVFIERFEEETTTAACPGYVRRSLAQSLAAAVEKPKTQPKVQKQQQLPYVSKPTPPNSHQVHPHPHPHPQPISPSPVQQAQTEVELARLRAELEQTRLAGELERTSLQTQLAAAQDSRRSLEDEFEAWLERHQDKDRQLGKDFDFRREKLSGHYQPEYAPYNSPGGWGTTNAYGAGGASNFYCDVCGEWLRLPERFQPLKPR